MEIVKGPFALKPVAVTVYRAALIWLANCAAVGEYAWLTVLVAVADLVPSPNVHRQQLTPLVSENVTLTDVGVEVQ